MKFGIDFDNTLVCYDEAFHACARERQLIPDDVPATKAAVKAHLQNNDREEDWIALQGYVYGPGMATARPFDGALDFIREAQRQSHEVFIVSHKTRHPFRGPQYDLHEHARAWLVQQHILGDVIDRKNVFFELTKEEKLARVGELECDWFVDDLPSILEHHEFPPGVKRTLFDPSGSAAAQAGWTRIRSWAEAPECFDSNK